MIKRTVLTLLLLAAAASAADRPDLVVVISIDQFRYEYLTRFAPYFAPDGFRRFIEHGADFTNAYYPYSVTVTGPGHAAIGTGYMPSQSGIVGNVWYDRAKAAPEYCVADSRVTGGFSPVNLQSDSLGDRVQEKFSGARVYGVAIKDRAAILMAGRKATAAYWLDSRSGFTSSSYYRADNTLTSTFNKTLVTYAGEHPIWAQSSFIPANDLPKLTHDPESLRKYKSDRDGLGVSFPHPIQGLDALTYTPFGNGLVIGFAEQLIEAEHLGTAGGPPDILFVGLSSPDYLGHYYGPDSLEVADSVVRTDRDVAGFLGYLDQHFADRYTVVMTADHGVQSIPEVARELGREAGRVNFRNPSASTHTLGQLSAYAPARAELERNAAAALDQKITDDTPVSDGLILFFEEPAAYLNWARIAALHVDGERVKRAVRDAALKLTGVSGAFTNSELLATHRDASPLEQAVRRSFRADRSGDVLITLEPGYIWDSGGTGTTHGQPVEDDQHVPVMLWGRGIAARHYDQRVSPTDLAKSLGALFGVSAGGSDTRVLPCMTSAQLQSVLQTVIAAAPKFEHLVARDAALRDAMSLTAPSDSTLPAGYARLDRLQINGDKATVTLWYGPIEQPKPAPGAVNLNCGTGYTYQLQRDANGQWLITTLGTIVC